MNIVGTDKGDVIHGTPDDDTILAKGGNDNVTGGAGFDTIYGGNGDDVLLGKGDSDTLHGGKGNDVLLGGYGSDDYYGGSGHDIFGFQVSAERAEDNDPIYDFQHGDHILVGHREKVFDFFDSNHDGVLNLADDNVFNEGGGKHDLILNFSPLVDDPDGSTFLYVHGVAGLHLDDFL
jgi:Ca2+-binding RTX toxin-like protein